MQSLTRKIIIMFKIIKVVIFYSQNITNKTNISVIGKNYEYK